MFIEPFLNKIDYCDFKNVMVTKQPESEGVSKLLERPANTFIKVY